MNAVQDISRITVWFQWKAYAASYVLIIATCLVSCISEIRWIMCPIFTVDRGYLLPIFYALIGGEALRTFIAKFTRNYKETRNIPLSYGMNYFDILDRLGMTRECLRPTDRWRYRPTDFTIASYAPRFTGFRGQKLKIMTVNSILLVTSFQF